MTHRSFIDLSVAYKGWWYLLKSNIVRSKKYVIYYCNVCNSVSFNITCFWQKSTFYVFMQTSMSMPTLILACPVHDIIFDPLKKLIQILSLNLTELHLHSCGLYLARKHSSKEAECSFKKKTYFFTKYCFLTFHFNVKS